MFAGRKKKKRHKAWFAAMPLLSLYLLISLVTTSTLLLCSHVCLLLPCIYSLIFYLPLQFCAFFPLSLSPPSLFTLSTVRNVWIIPQSADSLLFCFIRLLSVIYLFSFLPCVCVRVRQHVVCRWHCTRTCSLMPVPLSLLCITNLFFHVLSESIQTCLVFSLLMNIMHTHSHPHTCARTLQSNTVSLYKVINLSLALWGLIVEWMNERPPGSS